LGFYKDTIKGISWMGGLRGVMRSMSFVRLAILARILTPVQFGVFGISSLILSFLEIITETGINVFLVQQKENIDEYIDSSWVVSIGRGVLISFAIFLIAPFVSTYFASPDSLYLIKLIAIVPFIRGFINPSIVKFQKDLHFDKEFRFRSILFFIDSVVAIIISLYTRSASGLIWGVIAGALAEVVWSFYIVKPRPKFIFEPEKTKKVINRGKYITFAGIFNWLAQQGDDGVVAKLLGESPLGFYQAAYKLSTFPLTEITQVVGKVTFPMYTTISQDKTALKRAFWRTSLALFVLILPVGIIMYLFPELIIRIVLGSQWTAAANVLKVLAIFGIIRASTGLANSLFLSQNRQDYVAVVALVQFAFLAITIVPLTRSFGILGAGYSSVIAGVAPLPLVAYYLGKIFKKL
jgi:O-antigen/teichoic acid export membrane protein